MSNQVCQHCHFSEWETTPDGFVCALCLHPGTAALPSYGCTGCGSASLVEFEGFMSCRDCGHVGAQLPVSASTYVGGSTRYYKRIFYVNELMSQLTCTDPGIPQDLLPLYRTAYRLYPTTRVNQRWVQKVSKLITATPTGPGQIRIPLTLSVKYITKDTLKPLLNFSRYAERWRTISYHLTGTQPPKLPSAFLNFVVDHFAYFESHFDRNRHAAACDGRKNCHKAFNCRHNIVRVYWIVKKFLLLKLGNRKHPLYLQMKPWLPVPTRRTRRQYYNQFWLSYARQMSRARNVWKLQPKPAS